MQPSDHLQAAESTSIDFGTPAHGWPTGWTVYEIAETGSTNSDLVEQHASLPDRTVLRTDHQTAGRGRLDRRWDAPPGSNLLVSLLFQRVPADPGVLMRRVALAAIGAVRAVADVDVALKWPNDLLVGDRKLAGLLAQRAGDGSIVVGIGLNVGWAPNDAARLGDDVGPAQVLEALLRAYDALPAAIDTLYRQELATIGQRVRVEFPDGELTGTAVDVESDGRLVVIDDCAISHRLSIGDVVHLRRA